MNGEQIEGGGFVAPFTPAERKPLRYQPGGIAPPGPPLVRRVQPGQTEYDPFHGATPEPKPDVVNHPPHYKTGGIETIDFIEAKELGYHEGNVVKYVARAKHKGAELQDLQKAQWYLARAIAALALPTPAPEATAATPKGGD